MNLQSYLFEHLLRLPPPDTRDVVVVRDLPVPMTDGAILLADRHHARGQERAPTILIRSPYGRASLLGTLLARPFAERGFQVLIQSCRGTFGSGGKLNPFRDEKTDGLATLEWLKEQPWFSGEVATFGPSYLGFVQWAIARDAGPMLKAMACQVTTSQFRDETYAGEAFTLENALWWLHLIHLQEKAPLAVLLGHLTAMRVLAPILRKLPLRDADKLAVGAHVDFFQDWLQHNAPGDPWWKPADHSDTVADVTAPVHMVTGWYDIFLPWQLRDHDVLAAAGRRPYLTIGPWSHSDKPLFAESIREGLAWFRAHMLGDHRGLREMPVRIFVMGAKQWREFPAWPPPGIRTERFHLTQGRGLSPAPPAPSAPDTYRYDPANPTPSVGGALLSPGGGPMDNRALEARPDVLTYTSAPLDRDLEVIGPVRAEIFFRSSLEHADVFVRVCDVAPSGKSVNLCDGLQRLVPGRPAPRPDGVLQVDVELWPTAHRFLRGHRIRVQVSSGAHPRYARNTGSGEPLGTATRLVLADQAIYHDPEHPSAVLFPVMPS